MIGPVVELENVLGRDQCRELLEFSIDREDAFRQATVLKDDRKAIDTEYRKSSVYADIGSVMSAHCKYLIDTAHASVRKIGFKRFDAAHRELSLVAHGDGSFFKRHADTITGEYSHRKSSMRAVSAIFYFHRRPKQFRGGQLRIYSLLGDEFVDIEPSHNKLVLFPSIVPHEVMPIECPSKKFEDSRFAINIWLHKARTENA